MFFLGGAIPLPTVAGLPATTVPLRIWARHPGTGVLRSGLGSATALQCDLRHITHALWFWFPLQSNGTVDDLGDF